MPPKKQQHDSNDGNDGTILSKVQEDEMTSALIAKLLAQDAMDDGGDDYYSEYSNNSRRYANYKGNNSEHDDSYEEESDDYAPKRSGKPKKPKAKKAEQAERRGRKRKNVSMDIDANANTTEGTMEPILSNTSSSEPGSKTIKPEKTKKVKKPLPPGFNTGIYTDQEEVLFLEGMDLYGRNWNDLSRHMGTRDPHSIRSHAQKHFIKLYRDNLPLPDKVKESGEGFTLSGKPLDPDSAAAKPYLNRSAMGTKTSTTTSALQPTATINANGAPVAKKTNDTEPLPTNVSKDDPMQIDSTTACEATNGTEQATADLDIGSISLKPTKQKSPSSAANKSGSSSPNPKKVKKETNRARQNEPPITTYEDNGRTNYAASRLRRPESRNSINYDNLTNDGDRLTMVKCQPFNGKPGSDAFGAQPFEMTVHSNVLLTMDFHAHLVSAEIIGFLAGEWDRTAKRLIVKEAFPCRSLNTGQNDVNVEMDPTSALETRQLIEDKNMTVVGWYHSHPLFIPDPSLVDIENQLNYQNLCRDECHITNENTSASTPVNIMQDSTASDCVSTSAAPPPSLTSSQNDNDNTQKKEIPELSNSKATSTSSTPSTSSSSSTMVMEPFVGAIVGPYDPKLPASASVFNWFHVANNRNEQKIPKQLIYDLQEDAALPLDVEKRLFQLPIDYQTSPEKVNFGDQWRQDSPETKLEKLIKSLGARMPWIQRRMFRLQQQQQQQQQQTTTALDHQDPMAALTSTVDDICVGDSQAGSETIVGGDAIEKQASTNGDDNELTDAFLEKVQATLQHW